MLRATQSSMKSEASLISINKGKLEQKALELEAHVKALTQTLNEYKAFFSNARETWESTYCLISCTSFESFSLKNINDRCTSIRDSLDRPLRTLNDRLNLCQRRLLFLKGRGLVYLYC